MADPTPGKVYHTQDGKTLFMDPKTGQVSIFEGHLTLGQVLAPSIGVTQPQHDGAVNFDSILKELLPGMASFDIIISAEPVIKEPAQISSQSDEPVDILGIKDYFILGPSKGLPMAISPARITAWVSEYRNGHHPDYQGYKKHRILPEQWNWLLNHQGKECSIVAWYDSECPVFVTLACQTHAKVIKPVRVVEEVVPTSEAPVDVLLLESSSVDTALESVLTEERDV